MVPEMQQKFVKEVKKWQKVKDNTLNSMASCAWSYDKPKRDLSNYVSGRKSQLNLKSYQYDFTPERQERKGIPKNQSDYANMKYTNSETHFVKVSNLDPITKAPSNISAKPSNEFSSPKKDFSENVPQEIRPKTWLTYDELLEKRKFNPRNRSVNKKNTYIGCVSHRPATYLNRRSYLN